jgi:hypothetical protein
MKEKPIDCGGPCEERKTSETGVENKPETRKIC